MVMIPLRLTFSLKKLVINRGSFSDVGICIRSWGVILRKLPDACGLEQAKS